MSIQLNSEKFIPTQRAEIKKAINQILDDFMEPLVNFTIIAEIKLIATAANIPQSFIDGVKFRKTGPNIGQVVNTWGTDETPLAKYFNYGTVMHWIEPKTAKALAWGGKGGSHATAIFFQGSPKNTGTIFDKGHYVSGVPKTEAMERGFAIGEKRLAVEGGKIVQKELRYVGK